MDPSRQHTVGRRFPHRFHQRFPHRFHRRFPHTDLQKCTTDALVEQLREAFIQSRNETFDRFQFFRCRQKEGESLEVFHSGVKNYSSVCNWNHLEESLVKCIFIQGMNNQKIQMALLSEKRTPSETLQYALARERGQESKKNDKHKHKPKYIKPMVQKNTIYTKQSTYYPNTPIRTNTRLPTMRQ